MVRPDPPLIRHRTEAGEAGDPVPQAETPGWEYLLFIDSLTEGFRSHEEQWGEFLDNYAEPTGTTIWPKNVTRDLERRVASVSRTISEITQIFSADAVERAFGRPGEEGCAEAIVEMAGRATRVYATLLSTASDARGAAVPEQARPVYSLIPELVRHPLQQMREFVSRMAELRPRIDANMITGPTSMGVVEVTVDLDLSVPQLTLHRILSAMESYESLSVRRLY